MKRNYIVSCSIIFSWLILFNSFQGICQQKKETIHDSLSIHGIVIDAVTKKPVSGINVTVPDYSAAITDDRGNFELKVPSYQVSILISGAGYQDKEIALKGRHEITAKIYQEPFQSFYDMARLPYRQERLSHVTYSMNALQLNDKWSRTSLESPAAYMQGITSGLNVIRRSGTPGIGAELFLRGYNSLLATNSPLIVIDGMIYDNNEYGNSFMSGYFHNPLSDVDIRDIEEITVIKDGTSTFGTKGANGVILITTGRAKELATRIDLEVSGGYNLVPAIIPVMNANDYRIYLTDLLTSQGLTQQQIANLPYMNDNLSNPSYFAYHSNTNWQKEVLHNSYNQNYYLRVTGGDNVATYALSLGYRNNEGIIKNTNDTKYYTRFNGDLNISQKLKAALNLSLISGSRNLQEQGFLNAYSPLNIALIKAPFIPVHVLNNQGVASPNLSPANTFNVANPVAILNGMQGINQSYRFFGSVRFSYQLNNSWDIQSLLGVTFDKVRESYFMPSNGVPPDTLVKGVAYNQTGSNVERLYSIYNDTRISYQHTFEQIHHVQAHLGIRYQANQSEAHYGLSYNTPTDQYVSVGMGQPALRTAGGQLGKWNWMNTYINASYNLLDKYFINGDLSFDASSRFGKQVREGIKINGQPFAVMPSISAGWVISSENFMSRLPFIELLKLRASYSQLGNDDIGDYTYRQLYISQNLLGLEGLYRGNVANPYLQWETVRKFDIGIDASFMNERLNVQADVYTDHTENMLTYQPLPTSSGFDSVMVNGGSMKNNGWELSLNGRIINHPQLKWDMGINVSHYKNRVLSIPGGQMTTNYAGATILTKPGYAANVFYGYKTNGVFTSDQEANASGLTYIDANGNAITPRGGDVRFVDLNGDHIINDSDRTIIGNPNPKLFGGISETFTWKRWQLDALFTFSLGSDIYNAQRRQLESMDNYNNQTLAIRNRWRADGQITSIPRVAWGDPSGNARFSDRWIENGSYLRLRYISLSYNIDFQNSAIKYLKIYITGNNLWTWTKYLGYDPEFSSTSGPIGQGVDIGLEPLFKTAQLGIRIGL
ncbi:SusC/RagA family TonB-linked outer membrane protein [Thermoflavifilum thermophilum]|uniref:TonB-linked outer membrane protein, SusC/RagA family n=1 Tax=Thermoflavifilum thermophilum TaxID=1393122 RepID=A0A1I7NIS4_9BACT|nr:SusC/RagA family TonB-linked outer membrane protein [Thermoflavifilum thermophilum]SFV34571.1 TonB-linked outer membrane protein, SusC/RagA family [Thermoflavifilum thermophilum]